MGTRSGDLDPGVLTYLMREKQFDAAQLEELGSKPNKSVEVRIGY
jgi:acetate kinase